MLCLEVVKVFLATEFLNHPSGVGLGEGGGKKVVGGLEEEGNAVEGEGAGGIEGG